MEYIYFIATPYRPSGAGMRRCNYNNLATLLWSLAKQGAYVPREQ